MVSIGMDAPRARTLTLGERLAARDASIAIKPRATALAVLRAKRALRVARGEVARGVIFVASLLAVLASRHALVLAGLAAWVVAAWWFAPIAGMVTLGAALFFLELRRK